MFHSPPWIMDLTAFIPIIIGIVVGFIVGTVARKLGLPGPTSIIRYVKNPDRLFFKDLEKGDETLRSILRAYDPQADAIPATLKIFRYRSDSGVLYETAFEFETMFERQDASLLGKEIYLSSTSRRVFKMSQNHGLSINVVANEKTLMANFSMLVNDFEAEQKLIELKELAEPSPVSRIEDWFHSLLYRQRGVDDDCCYFPFMWEMRIDGNPVSRGPITIEEDAAFLVGFDFLLVDDLRSMAEKTDDRQLREMYLQKVL